MWVCYITRHPSKLLLSKALKALNFYTYDYITDSYAFKPKEAYEQDINQSITMRKMSVALNSLDDILAQAQQKKKGMMDDKFETNTLAFIHFLKCSLQLDPAQRWTAKMLLFHPFIQDTDMMTMSIPQIESIRKESVEVNTSYAQRNFQKQESCPVSFDFEENSKSILTNVNITYRPALSLLSSDYFKGFIYGKLDQVLSSSEMSVIEHIRKNPDLFKFIDQQKHIFDPSPTPKAKQTLVHGASECFDQYLSYDSKCINPIKEKPKYSEIPSILRQSNIGILCPSENYAKMCKDLPTYIGQETLYSDNNWNSQEKSKFSLESLLCQPPFTRMGSDSYYKKKVENENKMNIGDTFGMKEGLMEFTESCYLPDNEISPNDHDNKETQVSGFPYYDNNKLIVSSPNRRRCNSDAEEKESNKNTQKNSSNTKPTFRKHNKNRRKTWKNNHRKTFVHGNSGVLDRNPYLHGISANNVGFLDKMTSLHS